MGYLCDALTATIKRGLRISVAKRFQWTGDVEPVGKYQYFTDNEVAGLQDSTCLKLSIARGKSGVPYRITRGLSTQAENDALPESVKDSAHLTGHAVDLACADSQTRYAMLSGLLAAGFNRIGIYAAHLHADDDATKPPNVIWYIQGT